MSDKELGDLQATRSDPLSVLDDDFGGKQSVPLIAVSDVYLKKRSEYSLQKQNKV